MSVGGGIAQGKRIRPRRPESPCESLLSNNRARILETVWHLGRGVRSRTLDTHASRLRSKLQIAPEHGWRLTTLYGYGYQLERLPVATPAMSSAEYPDSVSGNVGSKEKL
jgi:two-component system, OmpR family, response regulator